MIIKVSFFVYILINTLFIFQANALNKCYLRKQDLKTANTKSLSDTTNKKQFIRLDTVTITKNLNKFYFNTDKNRNQSALDLIKTNPHFIINEDEIFYKGSKIDQILINGNLFTFSTPIGLLKLFPANMVDNLSMERQTTPLNIFLNNIAKDINSININTINNKTDVLFGNTSLTWNLSNKINLDQSLFQLKDKKTSYINLNLNNTPRGWNYFDKNTKSISNQIDFQNILNLKKLSLEHRINFSSINELKKEIISDSLSYINSQNNKLDKLDFSNTTNSKTLSLNISEKATLIRKRHFIEIIPSLIINNSNNNSDFESATPTQIENHSKTVSILSNVNYIFKLDSTYRFIYFSQNYSVTNSTFSTNQNTNIVRKTINDVNLIKSSLTYRDASNKRIQFNTYINFSRNQENNKNSFDNLKNDEQNVFLRNINNNYGSNIEINLPQTNLTTNLFYEYNYTNYTQKRFIKNVEKGVNFNVSGKQNLLKNKLNISINISKFNTYPTITQKDEILIPLTFSYYKIGNKELKPENTLATQINATYSTDRDFISAGMSFNRVNNKIMENIIVLLDDTLLYNVYLLKGSRIIQLQNSTLKKDNRTTFNLNYTKPNFLSTNISINYSLVIEKLKSSRFIDYIPFLENSSSINNAFNFNYKHNSIFLSLNYSKNINYYSLTALNNPTINSKYNRDALDFRLKFYGFQLFNIEVQYLYDQSKYYNSSFSNNLLNLKLEKDILNKINCSLTVNDLFNNFKLRQNINNDGLTTQIKSERFIGRYCLLNISYKFSKFK